MSRLGSVESDGVTLGGHKGPSSHLLILPSSYPGLSPQCPKGTPITQEPAHVFWFKARRGQTGEEPALLSIFLREKRGDTPWRATATPPLLPPWSCRYCFPRKWALGTRDGENDCPVLGAADSTQHWNARAKEVWDGTLLLGCFFKKFLKWA